MQEVEENYILCMKLCLCPVISVMPVMPHRVTDVFFKNCFQNSMQRMGCSPHAVPRFNVKVELIPLFGTKEPDIVQDSARSIIMVVHFQLNLGCRKQ